MRHWSQERNEHREREAVRAGLQAGALAVAQPGRRSHLRPHLHGADRADLGLRRRLQPLRGSRSRGVRHHRDRDDLQCLELSRDGAAVPRRRLGLLLRPVGDLDLRRIHLRLGHPPRLPAPAGSALRLCVSRHGVSGHVRARLGMGGHLRRGHGLHQHHGRLGDGPDEQDLPCASSSPSSPSSSSGRPP